MYLNRRGSIWHFSRRLPNDSTVQPGRLIILSGQSVRIGKNGYLRFSLATSDKREALRLGRKYASELDKAIEAHARSAETADLPITDVDLKLAADLMQASLLAADEAQYRESVKAALSGETPERLSDREQNLVSVLPPATAAGDAQLLQQLSRVIPLYVLQATGKSIAGSLADYGDRLLPFVQGWRQTTMALQDRALGKTVLTPRDPRSDPASGARLSWAEMLKYYEKQHPRLAPRSRSLYHLAIRELSLFAQCDPIDLKRVRVVDWRDDLLSRISPKTVLTRLNAAGSVYRYALDNEKLGERSNPFNNVTVAGAKSAESGRKGFEPATLKRLFDNPPNLADIPDAVGGHAAFWIPLIALYTGARRGEMAGLLLDEVGQDDNGIWYLHFRNNVLRPLKNGVSERFIPIHDELIRLGFPAYVETARAAGVRQLFPGIADPDTLGEWFSGFVRDLLGVTDFMQDLHSFRHTFKTATRNAGLGLEIHDSLTGHATPGVGAQYGDRAGLLRLKEEIEKVHYRGLVLQLPPVATVGELKKQEVAAKRRLIAGQRRKAKAKAKVGRVVQGDLGRLLSRR